MAPDTDVLVVVPRRADGGHRDRLWAWLRERWEHAHPTYRLVEGHHDEGPFNRSAAINAGVAEGGPFDVLVIADGDSFVAPLQLERAVATAARTGQLTLAYDRFCYLDEAMSRRVVEGFDGSWEPGVAWSLDWTCSSMVVVPAALWAELGGADEGFVGWGGEDFALRHALETFGGGMHRIPGPVWHLWHPGAPHDADDVFPGRQALYADAAGNPVAMRRLVDGLRADLERTTTPVPS
ncbi:hypothetical protein KSP35_13065 [Aquihabitans sp. G128]|uniref:hypothetical protein n=1 Tax=Aquihabitans sp. G128 TaxID=2849779 RepID=UPI001C223502|nr:hypothetical protein [Aquihabitans sp. G128]QXC59333.1 hypothetical protein KSP35_13065 [Aquihabitans sp. G128]